MKKTNITKKEVVENKGFKIAKKTKDKPVKEKKKYTLQEKRDSRTSFTLSSRNSYDNLKRSNDANGVEYSLVRFGNSEYMEIGGKKYRYRDTDLYGKGFHISNMVKKDVAKYVANNQNFTRRGKNYKEFLFNEVALKKHKGKSVIAIDIKNCYWTTIYKLGYITQKTYFKALTNTEWKAGRNTAIGSLIKKVTKTTMKDSSIIKKERIPPNPDFVDIRHNIIGHVHDMFVEIYNKIGNGWIMCLSDCVFADFKHKKKILKIIESYGYDYKMQTIIMEEFNPYSRTIGWSTKDGYKSYYYNQRQVIKALNIKRVEFAI